MATIRTKTETPSRTCPTCAHVLLVVHLDDGSTRELDTQVPTWVYSGRVIEGHEVWIRSRSYGEHVCAGGHPC